jgi:[ribosomal protein S5]-alanine N-acetyltransferase
MTLDAGLCLIGEKISLHPFQESDITQQYLDWLADAETLRFSNQRFHSHTRESCVEYLRSFSNTGNYFFSIRLLESTKAVGTMTAYVSVNHRTADMGILLGDRSCWGQGIGLDAWRTLLDWLLVAKGMRKVTAGTLDCNKAMLRLMDKSGMHFEGARRRQEIVDGEERDIMYFAKFAHD